MKKENLKPWSKSDFDDAKAKYERAGYTVESKWRKGIKAIKLAAIVLREWNGETPATRNH